MRRVSGKVGYIVRSNLALWLILALFTALTLYQSVTLPLGEADDETDHYQYLRFVARTGHPPFTEAERNEAGFKGGLAPLYYWLTAWPIALVGEQTPPDIRRVDARPERHIPTDGLGINHVLHTLDESWPWQGQVLAFHLVRLLSLPLGWVTITVTYALARRLWPKNKEIAIIAAAFIAFLPRFIGSSAVINDDNLVFALISLLLLTQVISLQRQPPASPRLLALMGALFGLTLITKYFSLILIPEIILTLWLTLRQSDRKPQTADRPKRLNSPLLAFFIGLTLTAGFWFAFIPIRFNRVDTLGLISGLAASLGEPQITEGLVGLLSGQAVRPVAATYSLPDWFSLLYRSFWFEFGWMRIFAPFWVYGLYTVLLLLALVGHTLRFTIYDLRFTIFLKMGAASEKSLPLRPRLTAPIFWLLTLHLALFGGVVLIRYVLSATIDTGQGRHLYPALPVIALLIATGLSDLRFTILDLRFWIYDLRFTTLYPPSSIFRPPSSIFYLLLALLYLLPLPFILHPPALERGSSFILPVTLTPPNNLSIPYHHSLDFADGLSFDGFDTPVTATAGQALPVTLYWRAEREAKQDYLVSLCLVDEADRPAACWRGHFADGRYPTRAWEAGDTLADTLFIPLPACDQPDSSAYRLRLELWPLQPDSPEPRLEAAPLIQQTFAQPLITLQPGQTTQPVEVWQRDQRLTGPQPIQLNESLAWLDASGQDSPRFSSDSTVWPPVPGLETTLTTPCGPVSLSHFIAGPTLPPGPYFAASDGRNAPDVTLLPQLRDRILAPLTSTLTFTPYLSLLSLYLPDTPNSIQITPPTFNLQSPIANLPLYPGQILPLTLRWQARRWMPDPLIVSLKLVDKDFAVGGQRQAMLGDRYPNVLWAPTEMVEETYPLQIEPGAPPGLYRLEVSLIHQDKTLPDGYEYLSLAEGDTPLGNNLYPLTFRILDPATASAPPHPFSAQLGDSIRLTGYNLQPESPISNPQSPISLTLYWQPTTAIPADYTVFTQLVGPDGQVWAQWDNPPQAGRYPTTAWVADETVVDRYHLTLREGAPPGEYRLMVGMYHPATGQRLPAMVDGQPQPDNAILVTTLTIDN